MRRRALLLLVLGLPVAAHDAEFTQEQALLLRDYGERLRGLLRSGRLGAEEAATFKFDGFDSHDLVHVFDWADRTAEPAELRAAWACVCRSAAFRRGPLGDLEKASDLCFLLASTHDADLLRAYRLLRQEPLGEALDRAVVALARDPRPEVRLIAVRHATTLLFFARKTEGLVEAVLGGIGDESPAIAAACARYADESDDIRVMGRLVASLSDDRVLEALPFPLVRLPARERVGSLVAQRLSWVVWEERSARLAWRAPVPGRAWPARCEYVPLDADEICAWWNQHRAGFRRGAPAPMWRRVFDQVVVADRGTPLRLRLDTGTPLLLSLSSYSEHWGGGDGPIASSEAELSDVTYPDDEQHIAMLGALEQSVWAIGKGRTTWTVGTKDGSLAWKAAFLPTHRTGRVRIRLVIDIEHE